MQETICNTKFHNELMTEENLNSIDELELVTFIVRYKKYIYASYTRL